MLYTIYTIRIYFIETIDLTMNWRKNRITNWFFSFTSNFLHCKWLSIEFLSHSSIWFFAKLHSVFIGTTTLLICAFRFLTLSVLYLQQISQWQTILMSTTQFNNRKKKRWKDVFLLKCSIMIRVSFVGSRWSWLMLLSLFFHKLKRLSCLCSKYSVYRFSFSQCAFITSNRSSPYIVFTK